MKKLFKTLSRSVTMPLLTTILFFSILRDFSFPLIWGDEMCQTLSEDDFPSKTPITAED